MGWNLFGQKKKKKSEKWNIHTMFGPNLNFAVTEAYKLLRTNLRFSFPDEGQCRVIGITSSVQGEGKSTTACNTAFVLAEAGESVLLLEADLRRPSIASKLGLSKGPGLSNLLVCRSDYRETLQQCSEAPGLHVMTCGDVPPNPSELLSSNRMVQFVQQVKKEYDYIIIDLPPVTAVSDAVAVSKLLDGVVMVVRGGVAGQQGLAEAMRQLTMVGVRILGFVFRDAERNGRKYGKRYDGYYNQNANIAAKR